MRILVAPAPFKESMAAHHVAAAWATKLIDEGFETLVQPVSDGGEGFLDAFISQGAQYVETSTVDCLGQPVNAPYAVIGDTAVIEMARASGLEQIPIQHRDPINALSIGTGIQLLDALKQHPRRIIIGLGGSATNDGGLGLFMSLGGRVTDAGGNLIERIADMHADARLDLSGFTDMSDFPEIIAATDVRNKLLGSDGATFVYGPQKGISGDNLGLIDGRMKIWSDLVESWRGMNFGDVPGSGAAGGFGFGLLALCNASIRSGFDLVSEVTGLEEKIKNSDLVLTGEGRIDRQSAFGKAPQGILDIAQKYGVPVVAIAGMIENDAVIGKYAYTVSLSKLAGSSNEAMRNTGKWMASAIKKVCAEFISRHGDKNFSS